MLIRDLQKRAHATSKSKGWWDGVEGKPSPQCVLEKLCLVHTEVTEAYDELSHGYRTSILVGANLKPVGLPIELADVAIRVADLAEALEIDMGSEMVRDAALKEQCFGFDPVLRILHTHKLISCAVEAVREGREPNLSHIFAWVDLTAMSFGIDLARAIEIKVTYNETRPHRHGKLI